jgi:hypothetical protein
MSTADQIATMAAMVAMVAAAMTKFDLHMDNGVLPCRWVGRSLVSVQCELEVHFAFPDPARRRARRGRPGSKSLDEALTKVRPGRGASRAEVGVWGSVS